MAPVTDGVQVREQEGVVDLAGSGFVAPGVVGKLHVAEGPLSPRAHAFLTDAELALGVVLEPHVAISLEVSQHGWLGEDGSLTLGVPCVQQVARGRFLSVRVARPGELHGAEQKDLLSR